MTLSNKTVEAIKSLQKKYPEKRSALLPALHIAQSEAGYLPPEVQAEVAALFDIEPSEVAGVVSFYDMFHEKPIGKHLIHVCKNISCMLNGGDQVLEGLCRRLNIKPHGTTEDGEFTVVPSECLAACDRAPMMLIDDKVVGPVKEDEIDRIINEAKQGRGHASPIQCEEASHG